ncbi:alpha/beta hydrolase [bacterium]|nr:alpha/beta hydrolase [bacterium]
MTRLPVLACCLWIGQVTPAVTQSPSTPVTLPLSEQFDLSAASGRKYRIFLATPQSQPPAMGWPVIYLTDGNSNFPVLLAAAQRQGPGGLGAVVVGIGYPHDDERENRELRSYDLTPATHPEWITTHAGWMTIGKTGGQDEFLQWIEQELKPVIQSRAKIDRSRQTLFGHSFGGLFALHVLFTRPETFQNYVAVSPSIWWNDRSLLAEEQQFLKAHANHTVSARVFFAAGGDEQTPRPNEPKERATRLIEWRMIDSSREMAARLSESNIPGLEAEFRLFPEEHHGSVLLPAAGRGVRFALNQPHP